MTDTKKLNNFELYEINGELYSLHELKGFIESCEELSKNNARQTRFINALKLRCSELSERNMELESEIADMKFTQKMLNSEEAGRAFASELLGKPMTEADLAEEKAITAGENHYYEMGTALYGDDF